MIQVLYCPFYPLYRRNSLPSFKKKSIISRCIVTLGRLYETYFTALSLVSNK